MKLFSQRFWLRGPLTPKSPDGLITRTSWVSNQIYWRMEPGNYFKWSQVILINAKVWKSLLAILFHKTYPLELRGIFKKFYLSLETATTIFIMTMPGFFSMHNNITANGLLPVILSFCTTKSAYNKVLLHFTCPNCFTHGNMHNPWSFSHMGTLGS